jgi:hypothetical protein
MRSILLRRALLPLVAAFALAPALAPALAAQEQAAVRAVSFAPVDTPPSGENPGTKAGAAGGSRVGYMYLAGIGGAAVGVVGGGLIGLSQDCYEDECILDALLGAGVGTSLAIPTAVHVANRGRGNLLVSMLATSLVGAVGVGTAFAAGSGEVLVLTPVAQIVAAVVTERATTR